MAPSTFHPRTIYIVVISGLVAAVVPRLLPMPSPESTNCLSILILAALWWIAEPFPAYVTSLAVVPLSVVLHAIDPNPGTAAKVASAAFFDPTIFMFVSGFSIAAILDKYKITQRLSQPFVSQILAFSSSKSGGDFKFFAGISILCVAMSALVSNVAGAILVTAIGQSIIKQLRLDGPSQKRVLLTIAYSCNIGGMVVPISSPQNLIALVALRTVSGTDDTVSFGEWIAFALPVALSSLFAVYVVLRRQLGVSNLRYSSIRSGGDNFESEHEEHVAPWTQQQSIVLFAVLATVFGWCGFDQLGLDSIFGHMGIFGLAVIVTFHAVGLLTAADWQALPWPVLALLGGGITLGQAVERSGLLALVANQISHWLSTSNVWLVHFFLVLTIALIANFLSSTVCAIITLPVIAKLGLAQGHSKLFVLAAALMTSGAMGLPVSSFPNANAAAVIDGFGGSKAVLSTKDFVRTGFPIAVIVLCVLATGGFWYGSSLLGL